MVLQDRYDQIIRIPYFWSLLDLVCIYIYIYIYIYSRKDR
jgi:heme/copper-type cytochrome/quinol oxidase subunit 3